MPRGQRAVQQPIVAGEPRLRVPHQVFILSGCRNSRGHLNSNVGLLMNSSVTARLLTALLFVSHAFPPAVAQSVTASRSYRMGTVGNLEMTVPSSWQDNSKTLDKPQGVTLAYRLPSRTDFYMKVTAVWLPTEARTSRETGWVKRAIEKTARGLVGGQKPLPALAKISSL